MTRGEWETRWTLYGGCSQTYGFEDSVRGAWSAFLALTKVLLSAATAPTPAMSLLSFFVDILSF